jgi:hypothetical protein
MEAAMNWLCRFAAVGIALFPSANSVAVASTLNAALVTALVKMNGDYSTFTQYENATVAAETGHTRPAMDWSTLVGDIENQAKVIKAEPLSQAWASPPYWNISAMTCTSRATGIAELAPYIQRLETFLTDLQSDQQLLTNQLTQIYQSNQAIITLYSLIPKFQAIPEWGPPYAAQLLTLYTSVPPALGDIQTAVQKQKAVVTANINAVSSAIGGWRAELQQIERFTGPAPPGSYVRSCQGCNHDCTNLTCSCRTLSGNYTGSGINYNTCPGRSVENINGSLRCGTN